MDTAFNGNRWNKSRTVSTNHLEASKFDLNYVNSDMANNPGPANLASKYELLYFVHEKPKNLRIQVMHL